MTFKNALRLPTMWWVFTILMLLLWMFTPDIVENLYGREREAGSGAFGDTFGFITSGFSILTTMLVVAGLIFQREEIHQLEEALRQQGKEFEDQNALTRQQMAFHEIQTRIAAMPFFECLSSFIKGEDHPIRRTRPMHKLVLTNQGAAVYDVRVSLGVYTQGREFPMYEAGSVVVRARLDVGEKVAALEVSHVGPDFSRVLWSVSYVTGLGEAKFFQMGQIHHKESSTVYTEFDKEAQSIREDVMKRMRLNDL